MFFYVCFHNDIRNGWNQEFLSALCLYDIDIICSGLQDIFQCSVSRSIVCIYNIQTNQVLNEIRSLFQFNIFPIQV